MFLPAVISTAQDICEVRKGTEEGHNALHFLQFIDSERLTTLGLMADAADEVLFITRWLDTERFEKALLASQLEDFYKRVTYCFCEERGALRTGYTMHVLSLLEQGFQVFAPGSKVIGKPSEAVLSQCFQRMDHWCRLCLATIQSEFPGFEILQTFSLFCLTTAEPPHLEANELKRFTKVMGIEHTEFYREFLAVRPVAFRMFKAAVPEFMGAWRTALERMKQPFPLLRQALVRFGAWHESTGGVERLFAAGKALLGINRTNLEDGLIEDELFITCHETPGDIGHENWFTYAQDLWTKIYKGHRGPNTVTRIDKGVPRKKKK